MSSVKHLREFVGIVHEHRHPLSPQVWGGFALYPNALRKGISAIQDSPFPSMVQAGDEILKQSRFNFRTTKLSRLENRVLPDAYFKKIHKVFSTYDKRKPSLIYHHMNSFVLPPSWVIRLGDQYNLRLVTSIIDYQEHSHPEFLGPEVFKKRQRIYEITIGLGSGFVTASPFLSADTSELFGIPEENITVAPLGWDHIPQITELEQFDIAELTDDSKPYFVYPAKAWAHKGHTKLIDSLGRSYTDFKLLLVGGLGEQKKALMSSILASGKRDSIEILGYLDDVAHYALLMRSSGLIFPSVYEGFGMPYIEAAHLQTPVIAFENESVNHLLGHEGAYLVSSGDFEKLVEKVNFSLRDPKRQEKIKCAHAKTRMLTWRNTARLTLDMYEKAIQS